MEEETDLLPPFRLELEHGWGVDSIRFKIIEDPEPEVPDYGLKLPLTWKPFHDGYEALDFGEIDPEGFPSIDLPPVPAGDGIIEHGMVEPVS